MKRFGWRVPLALSLCLAAGCNRQDADALSNIGQILVARAKSLPITTPQGKIAKGFGTGAAEEDKDKN